eukprot:scaffold4850_cov213-Pinguiococcus_pyrenoidosus.AAC.24
MVIAAIDRVVYSSTPKILAGCMSRPQLLDGTTLEDLRAQFSKIGSKRFHSNFCRPKGSVLKSRLGNSSQMGPAEQNGVDRSHQWRASELDRNRFFYESSRGRHARGQHDG